MVEKQCSYKIDDAEGVTVRLIYRSGNLTVMVSRFVLDWGSGKISVSEAESCVRWSLEELKPQIMQYADKNDKL